ncbi:DUF6088 family protein [Rugamonas sp. DEMB1]|jgi:hypothetical protein|uniref:DUF6088 family protein n=1 Tax=Rugamonas sp. DEMB1 TaxID=3039386 RepID=UPI0024469889|nr:DUF6088 family protein [Rugamonas sp. DEMB1]WGG52149.1 DUF6088 family protein [Rugamonas sp. DEMB1]
MTTATIKKRISASIRSSKSKVFLRQEFDRFGEYRQVSRVIKELADKGQLARVGYGVYAKARPSTISGKSVPDDSLVNIGLEAMRKLGVKADIGKEARALREGRSTQMPMAPVISVGKSRVRRAIAIGNRKIVYEKD